VNRLATEYWMPLILWLVVIFIFSTDAFASSETSRVITPALQVLFPWLSVQQLEFWHAVLRKLGHITEYFVLAVLTYRVLKQYKSDLIQAKLRTLSFAVFVGTFDELHQGFTFFRTASPADIGYDCLGAVTALLLITMYEYRRLRTHSFL
jgi:VanZ family protein